MSGAFAGGVSVLLFQGIDVIKSRMQVSWAVHHVSMPLEVINVCSCFVIYSFSPYLTGSGCWKVQK